MYRVYKSKQRDSRELRFFLNVGHYHFVGAYAGATACLRGHSGSLHGHKLREVCLRGLRECGFVLKMPTRLQSGQLL